MAAERERIKVVGLCGSLREGSFTRLVVQLALDGAGEVGAETSLIDLNDYQLGFCKGPQPCPDDVNRMRRQVREAQGLILGTPEYHGSYSGVLKNALDLMGFEEFENKMVGLVGVGGGRLGASNALNHLRTVCRVLHSWVIPLEASVPRARHAFEEGILSDAPLADRLREIGRRVARYAYLHHGEAPLADLAGWDRSRGPN